MANAANSFLLLILSLMLAPALLCAQATSDANAQDALRTSSDAAAQLSAGEISKITAVINRFAENVYNGKTADAAKLCINSQSGFLSREFVEDFKRSKGTPLKVKDISGSAGDTISVILEFNGENGDIMTQEFVLLFNPRGGDFLIANIFDRLYETINENKKNCLANCAFLENSLYYFRRTLPDFSFSKEFAGPGVFKKITEAGFMTGIPKCPSGGEYSCSVSFDPDIASYEILVACASHGSLAEITKLYTNLDNFEKLFAGFERGEMPLARKYCGERLLKMFEARGLEKNAFEFIRTENINEAFEAFRKLREEEKHLGELYPALSDALMQIGHETEAVTLLEEAAACYPKWPLIKDKLKESGENHE
jgi:tetratricopeptide (TPR) repeat protein